MLQVHDIRKTRVYQEARQEGLEEGIEKERRRSILQLAARKMPPRRLRNPWDWTSIWFAKPWQKQATGQRDKRNGPGVDANGSASRIDLFLLFPQSPVGMPASTLGVCDFFRRRLGL